MTNTSQASVTSTTTISYEELMNATDPYAFTTESRSFGIPIEIQVLMCLLYGTLAFTAITSNMIVCYIVLSNQRMRTATNYFIVNLAVGDILMALFCIPFTFAPNLIFQYWPFGLSMCVIVSYSQTNSVFVSAYTMVAISIDKYLAIVYPMRLRMPKIQAKIIILVIWSAALLTSLPTALLSRLAPAVLDFSPTTVTTLKVPPASPGSYVTPTTPSPPSLPILPSSLTTKSQQSQVLSSTTPLPAAAEAAAPPSRIRLLSSSLFSNSTQQQAPLPQTTTTTLPSLTTQHSELNELHSRPTSPAILQPPPPLQTLSEQQQQQQEQRKYFCQESWSFWPHGKYYYSMALMILQFILPLFVLVITYSHIVIIVWGKRMPGEEDNARDARMARSKRKMIKMVIFCVIAFALTWLPFNALIVIGDVKPDIWEHQNIMYIWFTTHYLAMCHTITNPLIYIWMNNRFRAGFKQVIHDLYQPIRGLFVYLWYYCFCFACALNCSEKKYTRVVLRRSTRNSMKLASDGIQVMVGTGSSYNNMINNNNSNNNINNNSNIVNSTNTNNITQNSQQINNQNINHHHYLHPHNAQAQHQQHNSINYNYHQQQRHLQQQQHAAGNKMLRIPVAAAATSSTTTTAPQAATMTTSCNSQYTGSHSNIALDTLNGITDRPPSVTTLETIPLATTGGGGSCSCSRSGKLDNAYHSNCDSLNEQNKPTGKFSNKTRTINDNNNNNNNQTTDKRTHKHRKLRIVSGIAADNSSSTAATTSTSGSQQDDATSTLGTGGDGTNLIQETVIGAAAPLPLESGEEANTVCDKVIGVVASELDVGGGTITGSGAAARTTTTASNSNWIKRADGNSGGYGGVASSFVKSLASKRRNVCIVCYETMKSSLSLGSTKKASGSGAAVAASNFQESSSSLQQQQATRRCSAAAGFNHVQSNQIGADSSGGGGPIAADNKTTTTTSRSYDKWIGKADAGEECKEVKMAAALAHRKKRRRKQSHMISIQMTSTEYRHTNQQQARGATATTELENEQAPYKHATNKDQEACSHCCSSNHQKSSKKFLRSEKKKAKQRGGGACTGTCCSGCAAAQVATTDADALKSSCGGGGGSKCCVIGGGTRSRRLSCATDGYAPAGHHHNQTTSAGAAAGKEKRRGPAIDYDVEIRQGSGSGSSKSKRRQLKREQHKHQKQQQQQQQRPPQAFIIDMRQSSQSTATISMHTNTTSLTISPLNSPLKDAINSSTQSESCSSANEEAPPHDDDGGDAGSVNKAQSEPISSRPTAEAHERDPTLLAGGCGGDDADIGRLAAAADGNAPRSSKMNNDRTMSDTNCSFTAGKAAMESTKIIMMKLDKNHTERPTTKLASDERRPSLTATSNLTSSSLGVVDVNNMNNMENQQYNNNNNNNNHLHDQKQQQQQDYEVFLQDQEKVNGHDDEEEEEVEKENFGQDKRRMEKPVSQLASQQLTAIDSAIQ